MENKQEVTEMAIREITMRLPEELLQSLNETVEERNFTCDEALIRAMRIIKQIALHAGEQKFER